MRTQKVITAWGTSPNNVWAVGTGYITMHYNGKVAFVMMQAY